MSFKIEIFSRKTFAMKIPINKKILKEFFLNENLIYEDILKETLLNEKSNL